MLLVFTALGRTNFARPLISHYRRYIQPMLTALEGVFTLLEQTSSELATSQGMAVPVYAMGEVRAGRAGSNAFE